jgi:soluble lytic murein transglycosylase-like protein
MRFRLQIGSAIALIMCGLSAIPTHAQLSSYVDESGNVVFTNPISLPESTATAKPPSSGSLATAKPTAAVTATPVKPTAPIELDTMVQKTAEKHHVDAKLVRAVISTESNWNASAVSRKGALGLMQLIPTTAQRLGVGNAFDPAQNVDAGVRYLGMLLERYNGDLSRTLAAYNAGPGAVDRFGGVPNFRETRNYVEKVTANYFRPDSARPGLIAPGFVPLAPPPIYRKVEADGRVVFTNE